MPDVLKYVEHPTEFPAPESTAIWSDAAVWVPWALWQAYGDRQVLADHYDSMAAHVRRVESLMSPTGLWDTGFQFGDWLDPDRPAGRAGRAKADKGVVATACLYRSARLVADAAAILGRPTTRTLRRAGRAHRAAFNEHYVKTDGTILSDARPSTPWPSSSGCWTSETKQLAGDRLAELAAENGYRIQTGFAGTPYVTDALTAPVTSTTPTGCCWSGSARPGSIR